MLTRSMGELSNEAGPGILNETTGTIHKRARGNEALHSICGITYHVDSGHLRQTPVERAADSLNVTKCGRCFEDSGGY